MVWNSLILFAVLSLVENIYSHCENLKAVLTKAALVKMTVGWLVIQGIVCQFMISTDSEPYNDDSHWSSTEKLQRGYCKYEEYSTIKNHKKD